MNKDYHKCSNRSAFAIQRVSSLLHCAKFSMQTAKIVKGH